MGVVVSYPGERSAGTTALDDLTTLVGEDMTAVNAVILERMASQVTLIPKLAGYLVNSGGKRLRPMLTLAAARMCGYEGEHHLKLATAVEFIHTATLLHDDVVDASDMRRGRATANIIWGNSPSVLVGDFLFSRSFQLMVATGNLKVLDILSDAAAVIAAGEVMQLDTAHNMGTTEDTYLKVIEAKTAALFAAATRVGAVIAGRPQEEEEALLSYGKNLGITYQLVDDALDYAGVSSKLGKNTGDDFREGKITLPVVLAYRRGDAAERRFWRRAMEEKKQTADDLAHAVALMRAHRTIEDTQERARHYGAIAKDALGIFPDSPHRRALADLVDFCVSRSH